VAKTKWGAAPELVLPSPAPPPVPVARIVLSKDERAAIEHLRRRGAYIEVSSFGGEMLVDFPLGALHRRWTSDGTVPALCGQGIAYSYEPPVDGPPMTSRDLVYLERLPRLNRVNLAGTQATPSAIAAFRAEHPNVAVEGASGLIVPMMMLTKIEPDTHVDLGGTGASPLVQPLRVGPPIREPRKLRAVNPVYPPAAREAGIQGTVTLECTIDQHGRVTDARVVQSVPLLDQAALDAAKQWVYEPTLLNGAAVSVVTTVTFTFRLEEPKEPKTLPP
jgi:TonB family protein